MRTRMRTGDKNNTYEILAEKNADKKFLLTKILPAFIFSKEAPGCARIRLESLVGCGRIPWSDVTGFSGRMWPDSLVG